MIITDCFSFLITDFSFTKVEERTENWGIEIKYANDTTGVKITYEYREVYIFITIYQLHNGVMLDLPSHVDKNTELYCFGFDDAISILASDKLLKPMYDYEEDSKYCDKKNGLKYYVGQFADNLRVIGKPFLNGDFSLLPQLKSIIIERIEQWS